MPAKRNWKVGELARRTGLSVRTLHHYDAVGLLRPAGRSGSRHRLYSDSDVVRLGQIKSLRALGLSLDDVRAFLDRSDSSPLRVVEMHLERLDAEAVRLQMLRIRLRSLAESLKSTEGVSVEIVLKAIEEMTMMESYYTPEQLTYLARRRESIGEARIKEVEAAWPVLMAEVKAAMENGVEPASDEAKALAKRWMGLVEEFTGGDPNILQATGNLYKNESKVGGMDVGPMRGMMEFINAALKS